MEKLGILDKYGFALPDAQLATAPVYPPEAARLFVYNTKTDSVTFSTFADIEDFLPQNSTLVRNITRVVPAKITLLMDDGAFEAIVLANEPFDGENFRALITGGGHKPGDIAKLGTASIEFIRLDGAAWYVRCDQVHDLDSLIDVLNREGSAPLPPYITKRAVLDEAEAMSAYQSPFAREGVSVAAPTASLHFSPELVSSIQKAGHSFQDVVLNVGRGTFALVTPEMVNEKYLHKEEYVIPKETQVAIKAVRENNGPVIAIGTTATRALESWAKTGESTGWTDLFIMNPYEFKVVDVMVTNFHVPHSSLMAMVDAFLTHKGARRNIVDLYEIAIKEGFRFYSFGDGMLIL